VHVNVVTRDFFPDVRERHAKLRQATPNPESPRAGEDEVNRIAARMEDARDLREDVGAFHELGGDQVGALGVTLEASDEIPVGRDAPPVTQGLDAGIGAPDRYEGFDIEWIRDPRRPDPERRKLPLVP